MMRLIEVAGRNISYPPLNPIIKTKRGWVVQYNSNSKSQVKKMAMVGTIVLKKNDIVHRLFVLSI